LLDLGFFAGGSRQNTENIESAVSGKIHFPKRWVGEEVGKGRINALLGEHPSRGRGQLTFWGCSVQAARPSQLRLAETRALKTPARGAVASFFLSTTKHWEIRHVQGM